MNPLSKIVQSIQRWWKRVSEERARRLAKERQDREFWQRHEEFYPGGSSQSPEWRKIQRQILGRDHYRCVKCGRSGRFPKRKRGQPFKRSGPFVGLDVHHIKPLSRGGTNDLANLETLCRHCHETTHGRHLKGAR